MPRIALIAAVARNNVIGANGEMPWALPSDLKRFRKLTMGKPVIMGRKTLLSIGRALDGRLNIVISRNPAFSFAGATTALNLDAALTIASETSADEIAIIGGGELYAQAMPRADRLYITHVEAEPQGDTHFPPIDPAQFQKTFDEPILRSERDTANASFAIYQRIY